VDEMSAVAPVLIKERMTHADISSRHLSGDDN
jgi:hypothetical protein